MSPRYPCENKSRCPHAVLIGLRSDCSTPMGVAASTRPLCSASGSVAVVRVDRQPRASGRTSAFRGSGGPCRRCRSSSKGAIGLSRSRASTRLEGPVLRQQNERLVPFLSHAQRAIAGRRIRERVRGSASGGILPRGRGLSTKHRSRSLLCERPTPVLLDLRLGSADVGRDCFPHSFGYGQMDRRCHASRWSSVALPPSANTLAPVLLASGKI